MKPKAVLAYCREKGIKAVDLRFVDVAGDWRHITFPVTALTEACFEEGFGHDIVLSQVPSKGARHCVLVPQSEANYLDPFTSQPTLVLIASVQDLLMRQESVLDPRFVAKQAQSYLESTAIGESISLRASCQFQIERGIERGNAIGHNALTGNERVSGSGSLTENGSAPGSANSVHAVSAIGASTIGASTKGANANEAPRARDQYLVCGPEDVDFELRCEVANTASECGLQIDRHFRAAAASSELSLRPSGILEACDDVMMLRYLVSKFAQQQHLKTHLDHVWAKSQWSILRGGDSVFSGTAYRGLSDTGVYAIGGILKHCAAIAAISVTGVNGSRSESGGITYPWTRACSTTVDQALCGVSIASNNVRSRAIEFRGTPAGGNPYLVFSAVLMAMLDGIQNKIAPSPSIDAASDTWVCPKENENDAGTPQPNRALLSQSLRSDHEFLTRGNVFDEELIELLVSSLA